MAFSLPAEADKRLGADAADTSAGRPA